MIKTENITIKGKEYVKTYSDTGMMLARNGRRYSVAIEPINFVKKYTETDKPIHVNEPRKFKEPKYPYREATPMKPAEEEKSEGIEVSEESTPADPEVNEV